MWQEARKQEKKLRGMMVDHKKRAERRREYYEHIVSRLLKLVKINDMPHVRWKKCIKHHVKSAVAF